MMHDDFEDSIDRVVAILVAGFWIFILSALILAGYSACRLIF